MWVGFAEQVWDLGGQANLRPSWATYYQHTDCIIMVRVCAWVPTPPISFPTLSGGDIALLLPPP